MRLSILGLGNMGRALAGRALDTGHEVTVWNRSEGRDAELVGRGAASVGSPAEAAARGDVVLVVLTDDDAVRTVVTGPGGALGALGPDAVLGNVSTVSPELARELADVGPVDRVLDTPVMGSPTALASGHGTFLVGGPAATAARLEPLWHDLGAGATYCGPAGSGAVMKVLCNLQLVTGVAVLAEAVTVARANGIGDELIRSVFSTSPVVSEASRIRLGSLLDDAHPGWFGPGLAAKDVALARSTAAAAQVDARLADVVAELLGRVTAGGRPWEDFAAVIEAYRAPPGPDGGR